jgi:hypothetical protein
MANVATRTRADEERRERRRRDDGTLDRTNRLTLNIPEEIKAKYPEHDFRWTNDEGNRMYDRTRLDDWDKVDEVESIPVGTDRDGKPIKAHLCRKLKSFVAEDAAKHEADLREQEKGLIQGERDAASKADLPDAVAYTPGRNSINRGLSKPT